MNILLLGGQSPRHYDWVREVQHSLEDHGHVVVLHDYAHWLRGDNEIDLEVEIAAICQKATALQDYVIVAKSIGSVIATLANGRNLITPKACLFMGFPLKVVQEQFDEEIGQALPKLPKSFFIHNENDPLGSANDVRSYIAIRSQAETGFTVLPGDTHDYANFDTLNNLLVKL